MYKAVAFFLPFSIFSVCFIKHLHGLKCKQGFEVRLTGESSIEPEDECTDVTNAKYCAATICSTGDRGLRAGCLRSPGPMSSRRSADSDIVIRSAAQFDEVPNFATIHWLCAEKAQNAEQCANERKQIYEQMSNFKNVSCECLYGNEGEDFGNENFTLSAPDNSKEKVPMCKAGAIDSTTKIGSADVGFCLEGHHFCYAANCSAVGEQPVSFVMWSCAKTDDGSVCEELEQNGTRALNGTKMSCECQFGARNVDLANEMMKLRDLFPLLP